MGNKSKQEGIEDLSLALLYLTRFSDGRGSSFNEMAWKNYSFEAIEQLDKQDLIVDPQGRYRSKYAYITEKGRQKARKLLAEMGIETGDLYDRFDFREIHQDEAKQAAEIEKVCFPPNEACSRGHMIERAKVAFHATGSSFSGTSSAMQAAAISDAGLTLLPPCRNTA